MDTGGGIDLFRSPLARLPLVCAGLRWNITVILTLQLATQDNTRSALWQVRQHTEENLERTQRRRSPPPPHPPTPPPPLQPPDTYNPPVPHPRALKLHPSPLHTIINTSHRFLNTRLLVQRYLTKLPCLFLHRPRNLKKDLLFLSALCVVS